MKEELNLNCPYNVFLNKEIFIYSFTTNNHIAYNIIFSDAAYFFDGTSVNGKISKVYFLTVEKITKSKEPLDANVQATVNGIITHFFQDSENALIYICDLSDRREMALYRKFNAWFAQSSFKVQVLKINEQIADADLSTIYYTSIVYHINNPLKHELEIGYYEVISALRDK